MKNLITLLAILISLNVFSQFQKDMQSETHFSDLNTIYLQDGSGDYIVAGSKFNSAYSNAKLSLSRIDDLTGNIVWTKTYEDTLFTNFRGFDIVRYNDGEEKIVLTGSVKLNVSGNNNTIIAVFEAINGNLLNANTYGGSGNHANSQGLHIIYTESMINMMPMPGFVVAGFMNDSYDNNMAQSNIGFVIRVDENLLPIWAKEFDNDFLPGVDYDVVNNITETSDGYFLTGARSKAMSIPPFNFQEVLAMKVDFYGDFVWESSYIENNANGIGADAKYDAVTDRIYLLANYEAHQFFGVTVINNSTGIINTISSWYGQEASTQGWFGFELSESFDPNNMVVHGYKNYADWLDEDSVLINSRTVPFAYEFDRNLGTEVKTIQYDVTYDVPSSMNDFFYFWNTSIPKTYFPDVAFIAPASEMKYFRVAYRTKTVVDTKAEMIQLQSNLDNACFNSAFEINVNPLTTLVFEDTLQNIFFPFSSINFEGTLPTYNMASCESGGYIVDPSGITDFNSESLLLYPNPAKDILNIKFDGELKLVSIYNIVGAKVLESEQSTLDISTLEHGVYTVNILDKIGKNYTRKLIKN